MEQTYTSVRDFLQQQTLTTRSTNSNDDVVSITVLRLSEDPEEESIDTTQLTPGEIERLRRTDPFMYHSIVNETTGRRVCSFRGAEAEGPGAADAAAGGVSSDSAHGHGEVSSQAQGHVQPRRIPRRSSMPTIPTNHVVRRQRRFSTEEALSTSFMNMMLDGIDHLNDDEDEDLLIGVPVANEHVGIAHDSVNESDSGEVASQRRMDSWRLPRSVSSPSLGTSHVVRHQRRFSVEEQVRNEPSLGQQVFGQSFDNEPDNRDLFLRVILNEYDQADDRNSQSSPYTQEN
ncbi:hypothetical protein ACHAW6_004680 [Cyclotella cf. meneghiniana]